MKNFLAVLSIALLPMLLHAQADSAGTVKIRKNEQKQRTEGIATVAGLYYGSLPVDSFLKEDKVILTQDNGKLEIVSYDVSYISKGSVNVLSATSAKFPPGLKEAVKQGGSRLEFDNIIARYKNGTTVVLNPIILKLLDAAPYNGSRRQDKQKGFATVAGMCSGTVNTDVLLKFCFLEIAGVEKDVTLSSYDITYFYKGRALSFTSYDRQLPTDLITLIKATAGSSPRIYFDNVQVKHKNGDIEVLNPIILTLSQ